MRDIEIVFNYMIVHKEKIPLVALMIVLGLIFIVTIVLVRRELKKNVE